MSLNYWPTKQGFTCYVVLQAYIVLIKWTKFQELAEQVVHNLFVRWGE